MRMERESGKGNEREGEKVVVIQREREKGERGIEKVQNLYLFCKLEKVCRVRIIL